MQEYLTVRMTAASEAFMHEISVFLTSESMIENVSHLTAFSSSNFRSWSAIAVADGAAFNSLPVLGFGRKYISYPYIQST